MNFDKYDNKLDYPAPVAFTTIFWYKKGKLIATRAPNGEVVYEPGRQLADLQNATMEKSTDTDALNEARAAYNSESARLYDLFKQDLFDDLGIQDNPKREKLFSKAWEQGHGSGYAEIYNCAVDLVDLIEG